MSDAPIDTARDRYLVDVTPPPRWAVPVLAAVAVTAAAVTQISERTYGGRRVVVTDRRTGSVVGRFREGLLVGHRSPIGIMLAEADQLTADEFETMWLHSQHNRHGPG